MKIFLPLLLLSIAFNSLVKAQYGWAWMNGKDGAGGAAVFGTLGVPDSLNTPGPLYEACEWTDAQGNFWLTGGMNSSGSPFNTLWKFDPLINEWAWMGGSQACCISGTYGTQGVPDPANWPGSRKWGPSTWTDPAGNLWMFGGNGYDDFGGYSDMNDLWRYDIATGEWTWMKGSNTVNSNGTYGTKGVPSINNNPSARHEAACRWQGQDGNLWLFAGLDYNYSYLNDVWRYNPNTNEWTWMHGSNTPGAAAVYGTLGVPSPLNTPGARCVYNNWVDTAGNFWLFGGYSGTEHNDLWRYNPNTNEWTWMGGTNNGGNANGTYLSYCVEDSTTLPRSRYENRAVWSSPENKLWMFGGYRSTSNSAFNDLDYYDVNTGNWVWASGSSGGNPGGVYGTKEVPDTLNHPAGRCGSLAWLDQDCNLWMFGGCNFGNGGYYNDLWKYVPEPGCGACNAAPPPQIGATNVELCQKLCIDFFDQNSVNGTTWTWSFEQGSPATSSQQNPVFICYNTPGSFDVTLIECDAYGCDTFYYNDFITVYATPPAPLITQVADTLFSSPASSYQWQLNSVDIPGATNPFYVFTVGGYYTVAITDSNGCVSYGGLKVIGTGIQSPAGAAIAVYPNPSPGTFTVQAENLFAAALQITITNESGHTVYEWTENKPVQALQKEINLSHLPKGIYLLLVNGTLFTEKIVLR